MTFNDKNKEQLFEILSSTEKLVYLCGTGFSMSLGKHSLTSEWLPELYIAPPYTFECNEVTFFP